MKAKAIEPENDWEAKEDARHLMHAGEVLQDPGRHQKAMKHVNKQKKAINSISKLRAAASEKSDCSPDEKYGEM